MISQDVLRKNFWTLLTAVALVAVLVIYTICFTVQAGSTGVLRTFGAIEDLKTDPGIYWKWPWPIQSVSTVDTRTRLLTIPGVEELTVDQFNLLADVSIGWRISNAGRFVTRLKNSEADATRLLQSRVEDARKRVVNQIRLGDIISTDPAQEENFRNFEGRILESLREGLPQDSSEKDYGLEVEFVKVQRLAFPPAVSQSVLDLMVKERKRISQDYRSEGEREAKIIKDNAERQRKEILADAEAQAIIMKGEGDAEAVKYYEIFNRNPDLANYVRELDAFKATLNKNSTVVLPADSVPFRILQEEPPASIGAEK